MPFGLTNAPASFQSLLNDVLCPFLDRFAVVYLDDILIYSNTLDEHIQLVRQVLERLANAKLFVKLEKCRFHTSRVEFLGYIISSKGISMDQAKIDSVLSWPVPTSIKDAMFFLSFTNFYRRFISEYSSITAPLTLLLKKQNTTLPIFAWTPASQKAFETLQSKFQETSLLWYFDPAEAAIIEVDASDFALQGCLSQKDNEGLLCPVAFYSRKFSPPELNYEIYDKEMLAIVACLRE